MRSSYAIVAIAALLLLSGTLCAQDNTSSRPASAADAQARILVLQDGGVLTGQITRAADWYIVSRAGGQMQIAESRVMLVCHSMEEAYEFRRRQLSGEKAEPHLWLAEWCLRYNLLAGAERELADARRLDSDHPRLALLERRLEKIKTQPMVRASTPPASKAQPRIEKPTHPTLAVAGDLPNGVVENFTRKVQPVLVNTCATVGCHQVGSSHSFQLDRAILRGESNRRTTMHNLQAALALVDREHPEQSPLLTIPRKTHGGMSGPVFGQRQDAAFKHIVDWVALIATPAAPQQSPDQDAVVGDAKNAVATPAEAGKVTVTTPPVGLPTNVPAQVETTYPVSPDAAIDDDEPQTLRMPRRLQQGVKLEPWQPRDPFDPEIFNRLQFARARAAPATAPPTVAQPAADSSR